MSADSLGSGGKYGKRIDTGEADGAVWFLFWRQEEWRGISPPYSTGDVQKMPGEEQAQAREIPAGNGKNPSQGECLCSGTGPQEVVVGSPSWRSLRSWVDAAWQCSQPCSEQKAGAEDSGGPTNLSAVIWGFEDQLWNVSGPWTPASVVVWQDRLRVCRFDGGLAMSVYW